MHSFHTSLRLTIESAFYQNNVRELSSREALYLHALHAKETIVTDMSIYNPQSMGLPDDARVLVHNHGSIVGRTARARYIMGGKDDGKFVRLAQDIIANNANREFIRVDGHVGMDAGFALNTSLLIPSTSANNAYNFSLNFEHGFTDTSLAGLFLYVDPDWSNPEYPNGLVILDPISHCGAVFGLRYFGEIKKAVLSLAWNYANREGYIACHGGLKVLNDTVIAAFGLSGSGKSTLTLSHHQKSDRVSVLHDDAFVISKSMDSAFALEPSYFDKTADLTKESEPYLLTVQNNGVVKNDTGRKVVVAQDKRNVNGRCIKSMHATPNRIQRIDQSLDALIWIMKDDALPPLVRVNNSTLASSFGASLRTTRSTAENSKDVGKRVFAPYANPFRIYPLVEDFEKFESLFEEGRTACFIMNTGTYCGKKIPPEVSIGLMEQIANGSLDLLPLTDTGVLEYARVESFDVELTDEAPSQALEQTLSERQQYVSQLVHDYGIPKRAVEAFNLSIVKK